MQPAPQATERDAGVESHEFGSTEAGRSIGVLFRLVWSKIEGTGLDGFYSIYQGHLFSKKDTYEQKDDYKIPICGQKAPAGCGWLVVFGGHEKVEKET